MSKIVNVRIDGRLIHGQVCTQWVHQKGANKIFIIDDIIAKNDFLAQICVKASPVGTTLEVISCEEAGKRWEANEFNCDDSIFIIFQTLDMAIKAYKSGFKYKTLNFGTTLNKGEMVKSGVGSICIKAEHAPQLEEMAKDGVEITFQVTPNDSKVTWDEVKRKAFPEVK